MQIYRLRKNAQAVSMSFVAKFAHFSVICSRGVRLSEYMVSQLLPIIA